MAAKNCLELNRHHRTYAWTFDFNVTCNMSHEGQVVMCVGVREALAKVVISSSNKFTQRGKNVVIFHEVHYQLQDWASM